jgi:TRAP-type uncharacterized transport system substrate-binding protein
MAVKDMTNFKWPEKFSAVGWMGLGQKLLGSWFPILAETTGMECRVMFTPDSVNRFRWLHYGTTDMTAGGTTETSQMFEGDRRYSKRDTGAFPLRAIWAQSKSNSGFFVRGDSHIKTIDDIGPGVKAVDMRNYLASQRIFEAFLVWSGKIKDVEGGDVDWVQANSSDHKAQLIVDGKADVAFAMPSSESIYRAEKNPHGIRWISLNSDEQPEGAKRFLDIDPLISFAPMFNGVESCQGVWGSVGISLHCMRADKDPEFVYAMCKWFEDNYDKFRDKHLWNEYMTFDSLMEEIPHTFFPLHDGLVEYLKDKGVWTDLMARRNKRNIDLVDRYIEFSRETYDLADEKRIWVHSRNPKYLEFWENQLEKSGLPRFRMFLGLEDDD